MNGHQHNYLDGLKQPICSGLKTLWDEVTWLTDLLMPAYCQLCHNPIAPISPIGPNRHAHQTSKLADNAQPTGTPAATTICANCATQCQQPPIDACPLCGEPYSAASVSAHLCSHCRQQQAYFIWIKTAGIYNDTLASAISQFKYQGKTTLATGLAQCMLAQLHSDIREFSPDLIVPVPLHISRLRERGFNQSLLLAQKISKKLTIALCATALQRTRPTSSQAQLNAKQRRTNLNGAFATKLQLPPQRILLVDDIVTTGATVRCCAKVLSQQGHNVAVVALGRASLT